jgi:hypothetical protein
MKHLCDSLLCKQACMGLNKHKVVFWNLIFLKEVLQEINRKFKIVFKQSFQINSKSFKSLWIFNQHKQNKNENFPPEIDKILGRYRLPPLKKSRPRDWRG